MKTFVIDSRHFDDIPGFFRELNRLFMQGEDWQLGESLDAFDDLLYGGYGALAGQKEIRLLWRGAHKSRTDLGPETTQDFYRNKLLQPQRYNPAWARQQLAALEAGTGKTYFETLLEIIAQHPNIHLSLLPH